MTMTDTIRPASTLILARDRGGLEVLMVKRHHQIDFVAGAMVFPGGKVHDGDSDPAWADLVPDWASIPVLERGPRIAAIRECFEECGLIVGDPGRVEPGPRTIAARLAIDRRELDFIDYVRAMEIRIDPARLTLFARWLTPPVVPKRFDTFFYLVSAPQDQDALADGREAVETEWIAPQAALALAARGSRHIVLPTRMNLKHLAEAGTIDRARAAAEARPPRTVIPRIVTRGQNRFLQLDEEDGYGIVEEPLDLP
ncbi:NUDIX hydrolase [Paracoccus sp. YIM 132242]|uniref:NUDIX hydrolase n=1 Tax=Paracoccus lichenicola TaxID=2665644 RepID=A0A6L6HTX1_9RHOB|nr:NUDIX domain-containing protein [Paracoccus lichenicola]MTE01663.1 NUDIX hydrolase [Paracoccus lichenicola]